MSGDLFGQPAKDGVPLLGTENGDYDLGRLEPQTYYEVSWGLGVLGFTTGDAATPPPSALSPDVYVTRKPLDFAGCPLVEPQGCFDTGAPTRVRFDFGFARIWSLEVLSCGGGSVRRLLWPSACGAPVVESEDPIVCVRARSSNGAGFGEPSDFICSVPDVPLDTLPRSSGCQGAWPIEGAVTLAAADGVRVGTLSGPEVPVEAPPPAVPPSSAAPAEVDPAAATPTGSSAVASAGGCTLASAPEGPASSRRWGGAVLSLGVLLLGRRRRA